MAIVWGVCLLRRDADVSPPERKAHNTQTHRSAGEIWITRSLRLGVQQASTSMILAHLWVLVRLARICFRPRWGAEAQRRGPWPPDRRPFPGEPVSLV